MTSALAVAPPETAYPAPRQVLYSRPPEKPWRVVPAIAPYGLNQPTSADFGPPPDRLLLGVDVTTGAAVGAAVGMFAGAFLALQASPRMREFGASAAVIGAVLGAVSGHILGTALHPSQAEEVRQLRDAIQRSGNLSRQGIAAVVGVDRRSLAAWARGETQPSPTNLSRLRTLEGATSRLAGLGIPDLANALGDAETAGRFAVAVRTGDVDGSIDAVVGREDDAPPAQRMPALSSDQWAALVHLANQNLSAPAANLAPEEADEEPEPMSRPTRIQLEPASVRLRRRSAGPPRAE